MKAVLPRLRLPGPVPPDEDPLVEPSGELRPQEFLFRLGLLAGAGLFLVEGVGAPWRASPVVAMGALALSALIVSTLAIQWRVLGDWRRWTQQWMLAALVLVAAIPITGALSPTIDGSALPGFVRDPFANLLATLERAPGAGAAVAALRGMLVFMLYLVILVALALFSGPALRGGVLLVALAISGMALFFSPTAESLAGLLLLFVFLRVQWERPLMAPDSIAGRLRPDQVRFLRCLVREGSLSTGETKVLLRHDPAQFAELADFGLVEYDSVGRVVLPGARLEHDPARATMEAALKVSRRGLWIAGGLLYVVLPDFIPGPIDDIIVMAISLGAGIGWFDRTAPVRRVRRI